MLAKIADRRQEVKGHEYSCQQMHAPRQRRRDDLLLSSPASFFSPSAGQRNKKCKRREACMFKYRRLCCAALSRAHQDRVQVALPLRLYINVIFSTAAMAIVVDGPDSASLSALHRQNSPEIYRAAGKRSAESHQDSQPSGLRPARY